MRNCKYNRDPGSMNRKGWYSIDFYVTINTQKKQKMQLCDNYELTSNKISHVYLYSIFTIENATIK